MTAALSVEAAVARAGRGGPAAYPTETSWGLGADARSEAALAKLRAWKGRAAAIFPSTLRDLIAYSIILLILTFRPHGFFGEPYSARLRL